MPLYQVPLPNGTIVQIEGPPGVERQVQARAREYFRSAFPEEFESWRRTQMGLGTSIIGGAGRAVDEFQGALYSAAEGLGQSLNLPGLQNYGRQGRIEQALQAEAAQPEAFRTPLLESQGPADVGRAAAEVVTGSLPQTGTALAGALAGARLGRRAGLPGLVGGFLGGAAASYLPTAGSNIQRQVQEEAQRQGVTPAEITQIPSPGAAFTAAVPQTALESAGDVLTLGAARFLGRPAREAAGTLGQRLLRGAGMGAVTEAPTEAVQTGIERYQAGLPVTGPEAEREYLEAGLGGAIAGGVLGGAARGAFGARPAPAAPAPEAAPPPEGPAPAAPAAPRFEPITLPERPEPLASVAETEAFLAENPRFTPTVPLATPEAAQAFVNAARVADWQQTTTNIRQRAIDDFVGKPAAPASEAEAALPINRVAQAANFFTNLGEAQTIGNLDMNSFTPTQVARSALAVRDVDPGRPSKTELKSITEQLDGLADAGYLRKLTPRTYGISTAPVTPPAPTRAEAQAEVAALNEQLATGTVTPEMMQRMGAEAPSPQPPLNEPSLWQGYSLNAGPDARSSVVAQARNVAAVRQRPFTRPELVDFSTQISAAPTPEARDQIANDFITRRAPTPTTPAAAPPPRGSVPSVGPAPATTSADAARAADPASGAGEPTETVEEALFTPPINEPLRQSQARINQQYNDSFRAGTFAKALASPIAFYGKQPIYKASADGMDRYYVRNHQGLSDVTALYGPMLEMPAESQARMVLALQDASVNRRDWNRGSFSAKENAAMDGVIAATQRQLDYVIDAYVTEYFNPNGASNPQDRARLEAFQQRKGDRLVIDMPANEVRAASPQGFAAMQSYNRLRNPFYIPQIARGTHFAAAYERQPGGKEKLVRIYFFDPVRGFPKKLRQKVGMQRDFEAIAIQRLREEFPDSARFRVMGRGIESENDARASELRRDGDFIANYMQQLSRVSGTEAKQVIARMSKEIDKAQMDRMFRPNNNLLRAVVPENAVDYVRETIPNYLIAANRMQARRAVRDDFNRSLEGYSNEEKAYWNDTFNYASTPTEAFGTGRALAFFVYLGFNLSTAVIQFTQNPTVLVPRLLRDGGGAIGTTRYALSAARDVYGTLDIAKSLGKELNYTKSLVDRGVLTSDEAAAIKKAVRDGRIPNIAREMRSSISAADFRNTGIADKDATAIAQGANKVVDLSGRFLSAVDETNRLTAFLAAYRLAKARPEVMARAGRLDNREYRTPYDYAEGVVSDTNFRSVKEDRALVQRFHPVAELMTQFMSPVFKLMEIYARSASQTIRGLKTGNPEMAKAAALQFAAMTAIQVGLAGVWSLPLAERMRELIEFVMKQAFDDPIDLEQGLERFLGNPFLASLLSYGLPHAQGTISLNSRLKIDPLPQGSVTEWDVLSLLGPVGGFGTKAMDFVDAYKMNDVYGMLYAFPLMPTAAANLIKAGQLAINEEQWTKRGGRILGPDDVRKAGASGLVPPPVQQAIGFAPPEFADIRRGAARIQELENLNKEPTKRANLELARYVLRAMEAQQNGRDQDVERYMADYRKRKEEILREQEGKPFEAQVQINEQSIVRRAQQDLLGRGSPEVLTRQTRVPARSEAARIAEEARWRDRQ